MIKYSNICTKMAFLLYYGDLRKPMKKLLTAGTGGQILVVWKERPQAYMTSLLVFLIGTHIQNIR